MKRTIVLPVDALLAIVSDYTRQTHDLPPDTVPVSLQINPSQQGAFGLMVQSESFTDDTPIHVKFDLKRIHAV